MFRRQALRSGCKSVSGDERAIPHVQIGHVTWCVTRRKNALQGANAVTVAKEDRRPKFHSRETEQLFPGFTCIE